MILMTRLDARWNDGFSSALLVGCDGELVGWLHQDRWYERGSRVPSVAWVLSRLRDEDPDRRGLAIALIELPALAADTSERREKLVDLARTKFGEELDDEPEPPATGVGPLDADGQHRLLDRLISAWNDAFQELDSACARGMEGEYQRFRSLSEVLFWTYTVDEVMNTAYRRLPEAVRIQAAEDTDREAVRIIAHNRRALATHAEIEYDPEGDRALDAYHRRQRDGKPYAHWSSLLLAGAFNPRFFGAVAWVRGKLTHEGLDEPIELRQMRPGSEPRWKWKQAAALVPQTRRERTRELYEQVLAGQDVLGLFSWLIDVFVDARWTLFRLVRSAEKELAGPNTPDLDSASGTGRVSNDAPED